MKKLIIAAPAIVAAALSIAACHTSDTAGNGAATNELVANEEAPLDVNATIDNGLVPADATLNDAAPGNGVAANAQ